MRIRNLLSTFHFSFLVIVSACLTVPLLLFISGHAAWMVKNDAAVYITAAVSFSGIFFVLARLTKLR